MYDMYTFQQLARLRYESRLAQAQKERLFGHTNHNWAGRLAAWIGERMIAAGEYLIKRYQCECAPASA